MSLGVPWRSLPHRLGVRARTKFRSRSPASADGPADRTSANGAAKQRTPLRARSRQVCSGNRLVQAAAEIGLPTAHPSRTNVNSLAALLRNRQRETIKRYQAATRAAVDELERRIEFDPLIEIELLERISDRGAVAELRAHLRCPCEVEQAQRSASGAMGVDRA